MTRAALAVAVAASLVASGAAQARTPRHLATAAYTDPHEPRPGAKDPTIRSVPFDPAVTVYLTSTDLSPVELVMAPGERVVLLSGARVSSDPKDAKDWFVKYANNIIIFQPLKQMAPSIVFLQSETADGTTRVYPPIRLQTRTGDVADTTDPDVIVEAYFVYPHETSAAEIAAAQARRDAAAEAHAKDVLTQAQYSAPRNRDYVKRDPVGCPYLAPVEVSDDGHFTTLLFSPHQTLPNVFWVNPDGKEVIVKPDPTSTQSGVLLTLTNTYRELRLRADNKVCALKNNAYDPIGTEPGGGSGTAAPNVIRETRGP